jgi:hypothetical protein
MNGPLGLVAKGPGHRAWWFACGNLCPLCHPPGPAVLTTRKAGAEPALSGCRTLSASIPIPRRAEILAVPRRESDDPTLPRVAGSKEWPNRALSYAVALSVPLTGRVEVSVCSPLLTATPQQRPCRAHFRHCQSATRPRMLPPQSTSPLLWDRDCCGVAVHPPPTIERPFGLGGRASFAIACFADIRPTWLRQPGPRLWRGDRPARRRAGNAAKAASARCRAQSHDRAARKCRRRASRPSLGGQSPSRAQAATERG